MWVLAPEGRDDQYSGPVTQAGLVEHSPGVRCREGSGTYSSDEAKL